MQDTQTLPGDWKAVEQERQRGSGFINLLRMVRAHYWLMALTILSGVFNQGMAIATATTGAYIVGLAATSTRVEQLYLALTLLGALVIGRALMAWAEMWWAHDLAYRILSVMRNKAYWALERLAPGYLLERRSGDMASAVMSDVETLEWFYAHTVGTFIVACIVTCAAFIALAFLNPLLALILIPPLLLVIAVPYALRNVAQKQGATLKAQLALVNADMVDGVQGLREIIAFNQGANELEKLSQNNRDLVRAQLAHGKRLGIEKALTRGLAALGMVSVLALAASLVAQGQLAAVWFPVAVVLAAYIFNPTLELMGVTGNFGLIGASAQRVFDILLRPPLVTDRVKHAPAQKITPHVRFENVSFRYAPNLPNALQDVSFEVRPGETVALVGHSGAGKSTATHLLFRFWDVDAGRITIGGHDVRDLPQANLRERIALVPQDIYLFNQSLRDNLRLGKADASDAEIEAATRAGLAHEFISQLPQGYDTNAGERGAQMSGGQRQRVAISRALLKNAPILVMDEAVSNLDTENERLLQQAMARLRAGRTTLIIAHRLSTIRSADRIVVLDRGRVAETGTHDELLAREGVYAKLIASQRAGILDL